jgi:murein L,D-transpeptidase YcbB/YkuD
MPFRRKRRAPPAPTFSPRLLLALIAVLLVAGAAVYFAGPIQSRILPDRVALRQALSAPEAQFMQRAYAARHFKPIWIGDTDAAQELVGVLQAAERDGLSAETYAPDGLARALSRLSESARSERARTELQLSSAYVRYVRDLHTPAPGADLHFTDAGLQPTFRDPVAIMAHLASARDAVAAAQQAFKMNVLYTQMREALARHRTAEPDDTATEALLLVNLDRLRAIPGNPGKRFAFVDIASNRLWLFEDGRAVDSMKIIVGTAEHPTPPMAALIRYSTFNPFWNVPPDIARDTYAPQIRANKAVLTRLQMDPWSDFTPRGRRLSPDAVDWSAVVSGQTLAWLRQRPGPHNAMGTVKFMLPNVLGIYLHDTPEKGLFDREQRFFSAGCVRVEDAERFSRWLYHGVNARPPGKGPEQRVDLDSPTPVYMVYLTAMPQGQGLEMRRDAYGLDRGLLQARIARASELVRVRAELAEAR